MPLKSISCKCGNPMDARSKSGMCKVCYGIFRAANKKPKKKSGNQYKLFGKSHYERNKAYYYAKVKARKKEISEFVYDYKKQHPCVDCGCSDYRALQFDHISNDKEIDIAVAVNRGWSKERILSEIKKCEVRCANCHQIITLTRKHALLA